MNSGSLLQNVIQLADNPWIPGAVLAKRHAELKVSTARTGIAHILICSQVAKQNLFHSLPALALSGTHTVIIFYLFFALRIDRKKVVPAILFILYFFSPRKALFLSGGKVIVWDHFRWQTHRGGGKGGPKGPTKVCKLTVV